MLHFLDPQDLACVPVADEEVLLPCKNLLTRVQEHVDGLLAVFVFHLFVQVEVQVQVVLLFFL